MKNEFYASDVTKITGVKLNRLQPWMDKGWITPSIQKASGHGTRNIFSLADLFNIAFFKKAVESGLLRKATSKFLPTFSDFLTPDIKSIHEGKVSFPKPVYLLFFRKNGEIIGTSFARPGVEGTLIKSLESHNADDVIGINTSEIMQEIAKKIGIEIQFYTEV